MKTIVRKYRKLLVSLVIIFLFAFSSNVFSETIMTEDWEGPNWLNNYYDSGTQHTRSSSMAHAGSYSMPSNLPQGFYLMR